MAAPALSTPFQPYVYQNAQADVTPFQIFGVESQVIQIMVKPQDKVQAKSGCLCYMSASMQPEAPPENGGGVLQWLTGKIETVSTFMNTGTEDGYIGFTAPCLARILPIDLAVFGGEIICQREAFLASVNDVTIKNLTPRRPRGGYFVAEFCQGLLSQKLTGQGLAFVAAGGSVLQKKLIRGEVIVVDIPCVVAMTTTVECDIKQAGSARRALFGGECPFQAHLTGPGIVFIQSLPSQRFAHRIARTVTAPYFRENPRLYVFFAFFFLMAYAMIITSLIFTEP